MQVTMIAMVLGGPELPRSGCPGWRALWLIEINQRGDSCLPHPSSVTVGVLAFSLLLPHQTWLTLPLIFPFILLGYLEGCSAYWQSLLLILFCILQLLGCLLPSAVPILFSPIGGHSILLFIQNAYILCLAVPSQ